MEHSIRFPLPFNIHVGFVIFSVIMLILCYKKKKNAYELYMLIGVASTMLIYVFYILGLEEIILFIMTVVDMVKVSKKAQAEEKARLESKSEAADETVNEKSDNADIAEDTADSTEENKDDSAE